MCVWWWGEEPLGLALIIVVVPFVTPAASTGSSLVCGGGRDLERPIRPTKKKLNEVGHTFSYTVLQYHL